VAVLANREHVGGPRNTAEFRLETEPSLESGPSIVLPAGVRRGMEIDFFNRVLTNIAEIEIPVRPSKENFHGFLRPRAHNSLCIPAKSGFVGGMA